MADDAGALLVRTGLIDHQALVAARQGCTSHGGTLGEQLVMTGLIGDEALTEFYRSRLLVPQVNPNTLARLSPQVVAAIPSDMAIEFRCVPVALDGEGNLTVAMSDPSDRHAVDEIGFFTGKYVVRAVATQMQIAWCLAHYYGHITELGRRLLKPSGAAPTAPTPAPAATPATGVPTAPLPRTRGFTGRVEASRHKVLPPGVSMMSVAARPSDELLTPTADDLARVEAAKLPPAPAPPPPPEKLPAAPSGPSSPVPAPTAAPEESGPYSQVHVSLMHGEEVTPPLGLHKRQIQPDPPELAARSGEMEAQDAKVPSADGLPAVVVAFDDDEPEAPASDRAVTEDDVDVDTDDVDLQPIDDEEEDDDNTAVIHDTAGGTESQPILLMTKRSQELAAQPEPPPSSDDDDDEDGAEPVMLLQRKKSDPPPLGEEGPSDSIAAALRGAARRNTRREKRTVVGVGLPAVKPREVAAPVTPASEAPTAPNAPSAPVNEMVDIPTAPLPALTRLPAPASTAPVTAPATAPAAVADGSKPALPLPAAVDTAAPIERMATPTTGVPTLVAEAPSEGTTRPHIALPVMDDVDEGWGPPGTTIPPPFLGAMPGTESEPAWRGAIPLPSDLIDSAPLLVAPPSPPIAEAVAPTPSAPTPKPAPARPLDPAATVRELEAASTRMVELLRALDRAGSRDDVIDLLVTYIGESHEHVAFLVLKGQALLPFRPGPGTPPQMGLDQPSTLQDVVGTRLPYRGELRDAATRTFVMALFGSAPTEILALPVAVRDRVVGVLYADGRRRHTFDEHFAVAVRAAGLSLERVLQAKRAGTQS